jgi:Na+/melibiose symporter-like transporter
MGIAAASGQLIGGVLIQTAPGDVGWRLVFLINLPVAAAALLLSPAAVAESRSPAAPAVDWAGTGLASAALTLIVLPLVQGRQYGWPAWSFACLATAPAAAWLFGRRRAPGSLMADLQTVVMSAADVSSAGTVSSVMSTVQQVGNSIGVALIGIVFFGQLHHGFAGAFEWSEAGLAGLLLAVAGLSRLLPAPAAATARATASASGPASVETGAVERGYSAA